MKTGRSLALFLLVSSFFAYIVVAQVDTGIAIDGDRVASSFIIRDEYISTDDCLFKISQYTPAQVFRKIARFDLALGNFGSQDFFTTRTHPQSLCGGLNRFQGILDIEIFNAQGSSTPYVPQTKGICLEDSSPATFGTPTGTPATKANYTCTSGTNGISVGWQTVIPRENDMLSIDLTSLYDDADEGAFFRMSIRVSLSDLGNYTDVEYTHIFYLPYDNNCYPSPPFTITTTASQWATPVNDVALSYEYQNSTPRAIQIATPSLGSFDFATRPFCLANDPTQIFIRDNGILAFDSEAMPDNGPTGIEQYDNVLSGNVPYFIGRTVFPYWDAAGYLNSTVSEIRIDSTSPTDLYVTWIGIGVIGAASSELVDVQVRIKSTGDFVFSYQKIVNSGSSATVGICAGAVKDPFGNYSNGNFFFQSAVDNNCAIYSVNQAKLSTTTSVVFTKNTAADRKATLPTQPVANVTGPTTGQINSTYSFSAAFSQTSGPGPVEYQWIWGDGSIPSYGVSANHTWNSVSVYSIRLRVFDGIQYSKEANYTVYMGPIILTNNTITGGDGSDNNAGYIAIAVVLPILFVVVLVILLAIFLFVFFRRHVLPSGGAWWEEDPIYLNLEEQQ